MATDEHILKASATTPYLFLDKDRIVQNCDEFVDVFGSRQVFYAMKANSHPDVLKIVFQCGIGFEVSSVSELNLLREMGVSGDRIISSNPIKAPDFIRAAAAHGVRYFATDSVDDIAMLSEMAPGSRVTIRLSVSNEGSEWPLSRKFGVSREEALMLLVRAREENLVPYGATFHVGSQSSRLASWIEALDATHELWERAAQQDLTLLSLNLGGGFPIQYTKPIPGRRKMLEAAAEHASRLFPVGISMEVEPGRAIVGEAGTLVSTVVGTAPREGEEWLYLDVGVFNGLMEAVGGMQYRMSATHGGRPIRYTIAGPTCDSFDVIASNIELPRLKAGDKILIHSAGAYTTAYASTFNGSVIPHIVVE